MSRPDEKPLAARRRMSRCRKTEATFQWSWRILNACRSAPLAICFFFLLSIGGCTTTTPENGVQYFKRRAGVDLTACGRDPGVMFHAATRFDEQAGLSSGKLRLALLSAYPPGTPREIIFPTGETASIQMYEARYAWKGGGKYVSSVEGGRERQFEMVADSPEEKYQRLVVSVVFLGPWQHQLNFQFNAEDTLMDIQVLPSSGKQG